MTANFDWPTLPVGPVELRVASLVSGHEIRVRADSFSLEENEVVLSLLLGAQPPILYDPAQISANLVRMHFDHPAVYSDSDISMGGGLDLGNVTMDAMPLGGVRRFIASIVLPDGTRGTFSVKAHEYRIESGFIWFSLRILGESTALFDIASVPAGIVFRVVED